jgi:hypothetical protein
MKKFCILYFILVASCNVLAQQKLLSPKEFLGYELGERFTRHHRVVDYFKHVADVMENVSLTQYGETYEYRPLVFAVITSKENFNNLEQIRLDNLRRTGIEDGSPSKEKKAIIWLSYNVHGNEASSLEASMLTLYELANPSNTKTKEWLKNTVVILDPCINPDGRDRYANFYYQYGNKPENPVAEAKEHREPWPGGRANHYLFDLNRDWAWITQQESQQRVKVYNQWMPHIHVDFHEQGYNSPYFFAPAAEPFHEIISPWQREFQFMIGKNNAKYFDEQGWLYFTKEVFDLYYPSYGDTYPTYNGAIGMTYEQAGGGSGGLSVTTETGDPLTLRDRLTHHHTTGLSTIEITSVNVNKVVDEFEKYFRDNNSNPASIYKAYVIKSDNNPDKIKQLTRMFDAHGIRYGHTATAKATRGFDYQTQAQNNFTISTDDIVISAYQPKSRFVTALLEPQSKLPDSLTYDITAWNLIYGYDLKAFALSERININRPFQPKIESNEGANSKPYIYVFKYQGMKDVELLTALMQKGIKVRSAERSFSMGGQTFEPGTLLIPRRNNEGIKDFDIIVQSTAGNFGRKIYTSSTGFMDKGKDVGSADVNFLKSPRVAVLFGDQTSSLSAGEIWYFFEQELHYPITQIGTDYVKNIDLKKFDVLVVPDGTYRLFDDTFQEQLSSFVSAGGKLIIIGNGLNAFVEKKDFSLKRYLNDDEKSEAEKKEKELKEKEGLKRYEDAERKQLSDVISGAIYKVSLDNSHPLAFGLKNTYYTLKTSELRFSFLEDGWNVGVIRGKAKPVQGFAGLKANQKMDNSLVFGVEDKGQGEIIYLVDNPLFRSFWENGKLIFANAVFMVGQ